MRSAMRTSSSSLGCLRPEKMLDQIIELRLIAQAAEDDAFGQGEIARVARFAAQQVGGISAAVDALEYSEGDLAGRGHSYQYGGRYPQ